MKRTLFVAILVVGLIGVGAVAAFAAPGGPGWGMMGRGNYGHMGGYGMMGGAQGAPYGDGMMGYGSMMGDDLEELLGISHADIHAAHVAGKSLVDIAAEKDVTAAKLIETILDGRRAALDQAVEAGRLTRDAADQMLEFMQSNIETMVNARGMMGGLGRGGGMMGGQGMMGGYRGVGPCHGGQAPAQQGTGVRDNLRLAPEWVQQG